MMKRIDLDGWGAITSAAAMGPAIAAGAYWGLPLLLPAARPWVQMAEVPLGETAAICVLATFAAGAGAHWLKGGIAAVLAYGLGWGLWHLGQIADWAWTATPVAPPGWAALVGWRPGFWGALAREFARYPAWAALMVGTAGVSGIALAAVFPPLMAPWLQRQRQIARARRLRKRPGWLDAAALDVMARAKAGLPLGLHCGRIVRYVPTQGVLLGGHHAVFAGTRAGKGVACVLPGIVDHDGPVVVIDVKGENMAICQRHRASRGRRQVVLNPFGLIDGKTSRINPMTYLRPGETLQRDIAVLADGLVIEIHGDDRWISDAARRLVEAALELLATMEPRERWSLAALSDLVQSPGRLGTFAKWQQAGDLCGGRIAKAGTSIVAMGSKEQGMILEHLDASLDWLKYDQMRNLTAPGGHSFSYDDLLAGKQDVYICIPQDMTKTLAGFMRVVLNTVLGAVTRQDGKTRVAQKILCAMDEFTRLGRMEKVMEIATIAAGGGVEAVFIVQDMATLESVYGPLDAKTLLGSCATTRIFGLGSGDDLTARWAESTMPMYILKRRNRSRGSDGKATFSEVEQKEKLLSAAELLELPPTVMLCRIRSNPGVLLDQIISHHHPAYRKRLDPNPVRAA